MVWAGDGEHSATWCVCVSRHAGLHQMPEQLGRMRRISGGDVGDQLLAGDEVVARRQSALATARCPSPPASAPACATAASRSPARPVPLCGIALAQRTEHDQLVHAVEELRAHGFAQQVLQLRRFHQLDLGRIQAIQGEDRFVDPLLQMRGLVLGDFVLQAAMLGELLVLECNQGLGQ